MSFNKQVDLRRSSSESFKAGEWQWIPFNRMMFENIDDHNNVTGLESRHFSKKKFINKNHSHSETHIQWDTQDKQDAQDASIGLKQSCKQANMQTKSCREAKRSLTLVGEREREWEDLLSLQLYPWIRWFLLLEFCEIYRRFTQRAGVDSTWTAKRIKRLNWSASCHGLRALTTTDRDWIRFM